MRELDQILQLWDKAKQAGEAAVLATVVKTQGSSYRLPGARMLLTRGGQRAGSISGGCLEDDLVKRAWWLTEAGPVLRRYDTTSDGEIGTGGFGLGCNGIIHVLLERVLPSKETVLDWMLRVTSERAFAVACHILTPPEEAGQRILMKPDGRSEHTTVDYAFTQSLLGLAGSALDGKVSGTVTIDGREVFVETLAPPVRLLIFGAGDDAVPLTEIASHIGWRTHIYDGRSHYARPEKFPRACSVRVWELGEPLDLPIDPWTVAVLMTHSYSQDLNALRQLAKNPPSYLGVLGPRKRSVQLFADAGLDAADFGSAVHSPMGLDIGADGPDQVALAVVSEIQAFLNGRNGGQLRNRLGSIHARQESCEAEEAWVGPIACA